MPLRVGVAHRHPAGAALGADDGDRRRADVLHDPDRPRPEADVARVVVVRDGDGRPVRLAHGGVAARRLDLRVEVLLQLRRRCR